MDCRRYSAASRHEVLLDEDEFRSFIQTLELGDVLLPLQLSVTVLVLWNQLCVPLFHPPSRVSPYLFDHFQHCLGVKTQRFVDSCPDTGFPVLVEFLTSSRANLVRSRDSFLHPITSFPILDNWVLVFSSIRWMSLLLLATSESPKSHVQLSL